MNNKGMTLIEVLVAFSLLLVITLGLFELVTKVGSELNDKKQIKQISDYNDTINRKIHTDLIKKAPFTVAYKNKKEESFTCKSKGSCNINNNSFTTSYNSKSITLDLDKICSSTYPCLVYTYIEDNEIKHKNLVININNEKLEYGVGYNDIFEAPLNQDIRFGTERIYLTVDEKGFLVIDYPVYLIGNNTNFGFKIAYPFLEK